MGPKIFDKLKMLAEAAKYDVSCASSGTSRSNTEKTIGSAAGWGICHSFTEDGRCVSLLKTMLTNHCIYDCGYCANRRSNDIVSIRPVTSKKAVGSSNKMTGHCCANALAIIAFCRSPSLNSDT